MDDTGRRFYEFGPFRLDEAGRRLLRDGAEVRLRQDGKREARLPKKALDVLLFLVRNRDELARRSEIQEAVWPDAFVEDNQLSNAVSTLRKFLGDTAEESRFIETVPGEGYRFRADVRLVREEPVAVVEQVRERIFIEEEYGPEDVAAAAPPEPHALDAGASHALELMSRPHDDDDADADDATAPAGASRSPEASPGAARAHRRRRGGALERRVALAVLACLLVAAALAAAVFVPAYRGGGGNAAPTARRVAILPFQLLGSQGEGDAALQLGMTDALITRLSNVRRLTVRPTSSVLKYTAANRDLRAAGTELEADFVLDGKVQRAGDDVRLTVQLVRAADGVPVWADTFGAKFTNIFAVQDSISERVALALVPRLTEDERRGLAKRYTDNVEAYRLYLQGRQHWSTFTREGRETSINYYNEALKLDPEYALAYAGLANAYLVTGIYGPETPAEVIPKAQAAVRRALELDGGLAEAHASNGALKICYERDWPGAESALKRAIELNPNEVDGHNLYAYYLQAMGRVEEGLAEMRLAKEAAPQWHIPANDLLDALYLARRYDEAVEECRQMLRLNPNNRFASHVLGAALTQQGRYAEAEMELQRGLGVPTEEKHSKGRLLAELGYVYAVSGRSAEAAGVIAQLKGIQSAWGAMWIAKVYAGLGDRDQAFAWLTKAADGRFPFLYEVKIAPQYDKLRSDPRYAELLRRINLSV